MMCLHGLICLALQSEYDITAVLLLHASMCAAKLCVPWHKPVAAMQMQETLPTGCRRCMLSTSCR